MGVPKIYVLPIDYNKLTQSERKEVRLQYIEQQKELCYYCKEPLTGNVAGHVLDKKIEWKLFPKGFLKHPVHLHHDHQTGMTIGAVHSRCNAVLWQYHDE